MTLLRDRDVAKLLGITTSELRADMILGRGIPFVTEKGGRVRFRSEDVAPIIDQSAKQSVVKETMQVRTAAALYDVKPAYLANLLTRGIVKGQMVGGRWFVTPAEMDRVFKGIEPPKASAKK